LIFSDLGGGGCRLWLIYNRSTSSPMFLFIYLFIFLWVHNFCHVSVLPQLGDRSGLSFYSDSDKRREEQDALPINT